MKESIFKTQPTPEQLKALQESNPSGIVYLRELLVWGFINYKQFTQMKAQALVSIATGEPVDYSKFYDVELDETTEPNPDALYDSYIESNLMDQYAGGLA